MYDILNHIMMIVEMFLVHLIVLVLKANNHRQLTTRIPNRIVIIKILHDMKEILINMIKDVIEKKITLPKSIHNARKQNFVFGPFLFLLIICRNHRSVDVPVVRQRSNPVRSSDHNPSPARPPRPVNRRSSQPPMAVPFPHPASLLAGLFQFVSH